jgi:hypothetical protein
MPAPTPLRRPRRVVTWRTLADAPAGFDDDVGAGDWALAQGHLTAAAVWYGDAWRRTFADQGVNYRYFVTEAVLRLNALTGLCLCPPAHAHPSVPAAERWQALHELARIEFLGGYQPAIVRLASQLYRARRNREALGREGRAAWQVLMACPNLSFVALEHIDNQLLIEGLSRLRVELATHPAAGRDL